jgi:small-conductance mechanosensitive channel
MRPGDAKASAPASGIVTLRLAWLLPLLWFATLVAAAALAFGHIAFGGFIAGRISATLVGLATCLLASLLVDEFLGHGFGEGRRANQAVSQAVGVTPQTVELVATSLSGILRLVIAAFAVVFSVAPWGLQFGDVNPFDDTFLGFRLADLRLSIGTVGFALIAFVVGLFGTRLIVGWLDRRLLPLTTLDQGVRNSITTIVGYVGLAITIAVGLAQLGVNPQNLAVVAGALSVGIGFGLQSIVSNFVCGLIVLAERPIRVGDVVVIKGEEGKVKKISVRSTTIGSGDRSDLIVPNTDLITSIVRNRTLFDNRQRLKITVIVKHGSDPLKVRDIISTCAAHHANVLKQPAPVVLFMKFTEIGLEFELKCLVDHLDNTDTVRNDLHFQIDALFRQTGIRLASVAG